METTFCQPDVFVRFEARFSSSGPGARVIARTCLLESHAASDETFVRLRRVFLGFAPIQTHVKELHVSRLEHIHFRIKEGWIVVLL